MPVPKPHEGEDKNEFISRCISTLTKEDPDRPKDQIAAICYDSWRDNSKNARSLYDELVERFNKIRELLVSTFGKRGEALLNYTLIRLGIFDSKMEKFNMAALNGNIPLPFLKYDDSGVAIIGNLVAPPVKFTKIDRENSTVEGYANTVTIDTYSDIFLPESYKESFVEEYMKKTKPVYFMHHRDVPAGDLVELRFDELGMYVKVKPYTAYWELIDNGTLKGFSIGFWFKIWPDEVGLAYVSHKRYSIYGDDISLVTSPANLLSYYSETPPEVDKKRVDKFVSDPNRPMKPKVLVNAIRLSDAEISAHVRARTNLQSPKMTVRTDVTGANKNKIKGNRTMSEEENKAQESQEQEQKEDEFKPLSNEELMKMSPEEIWEYMEKKAEAKQKMQMIKKVRQVEEELKEAKDEDRLKELFNKIASLTAKIDDVKQEVTTLSAKLAIHDEKFTKIDQEVDDRPAISTKPSATDLQTLARKSMTFSDFHAKSMKQAGETT